MKKLQYLICMNRLIIHVLLIVVGVSMSSCIADRRPFTIYALIEDPIFMNRVVKQYNKIQKRYMATVRVITEYELRHVLENNMEKDTLYLLIAPHWIIEKAAERYLVAILPEYANDIRTEDFNQVGSNVVKRTRNHGFPLYIDDIDNEQGVTVPTLAIPKTIYKLDFYNAIIDFFQFLSQNEVNAQALLYRYIPIYADALVSVLTDKEQADVQLEVFPQGKLDFDFQPLYDAFPLAE